MKDRLIVFFFLLILTPVSPGSAQKALPDSLFPLKPKGSIPKEFIISPIERLENDLANYEEKSGKEPSNEVIDYFNWANYNHDRLFTNGRILFNDPVTNYINRIADKLLEDEPELRKKLNFYTVRTHHVNAFATQKGNIFVNLGFIAQASSEAQLAFVLSHEIVHYVKDHGLKEYLESLKIESETDQYSETSEYQKLLAKSLYSKKYEEEADGFGLERLLSKGYSSKGAFRTMDVFLYSYLPFNDQEFDTTFFNTEYVQFPDEYFKKETQSISIPDEVDDSWSTHPSIPKRRDSLKILLKKSGMDGKGKDYIVDKETFLRTRKMARYELSRLYLIEGRPIRSLYNTYLLLEKDPESKYLHKYLALGLHKLNYMKGVSIDPLDIDPEDIEGSAQQLHYFFDELPEEELAVLSLLKSYQYLKEHPEDKAMWKIHRSNIEVLVKEHEIKERHFFKRHPDSIKKEVDSLTIDSAKKENLSKYEKIELAQKKAALENKKDDDSDLSSYIKFSLVPFFQDSSLSAPFRKMQRENGGSNSLSDILGKGKDEEPEEKEEKKAKTSESSIEKILVVNPEYFISDEKNDKIAYKESFNHRSDLVNAIKGAAKRNEVPIEILDMKGLSAGDVDLYAQKCMLNDFLKDIATTESNTIFPTYQSSYLEEIRERTGCDRFLWLRRDSYKENYSVGKIVAFSTTIIGLPILPIYLMIGEHQVDQSWLFLDVAENEYLDHYNCSLDKRDGPDHIKQDMDILFKYLSELSQNPSEYE